MDTTTDAGADFAGAFANFATAWAGSNIPVGVRSRARYHMLDAIGIALAASKEPFAGPCLEGVRALAGAGEVPVVGTRAVLPPRDAALVNGIYCHGLDFDDTHLEGVVHPTAALLPTVLSAGWIADAPFAEVVAAFVLGVEVSARLGSVASGRFHAQGFHPTGVCNVFGAALAAGRLLGLDEGQARHAQGTALSMASGSLEFLEDGAWNKRMHPGWAAAAGITAASLAKAGFVGATAPYRGRYGLFRSYLGEEGAACRFERALGGLGERWAITETAIKPFPACHFTHGCVDAAIELGARLDPSRIRRVTALVPAEVVQVVCEPVANKRQPANAYDAQFSIPYLVATGLVRGRMTLDDLEPAALADPAVQRIAACTDYAVDPDSRFPAHYSGEVVVELADGESLRARRDVNPGAPSAPLGDDQIRAKFDANAGRAVSAAAAERICGLVTGSDEGSRRVLAALRDCF